MRVKIRLLLSGLTILFLCGNVTNAYFSDQTAVVNEIQMGDVDIKLREFSLENGKEIPYKDPKEIQPGDKISKIPRIINQAEPCWIRARVTFGKEEENLEGFSEENLFGISSKWIKRGDYYYYTEILKKEEAVDLFHEVRIPADWDNAYKEQYLSIGIQAEAIQAVHFNPDFPALSPWGNQEIELCIHEENDRIVKQKERIQHKIEFNGIAHKLLSVSDDFFCGFGTVMPGDSLTDYAWLANTTGYPAILYFHTEPASLNTEQEDLLKQLQLELKLNEQILYKGSLSSEPLGAERELINLKPEEKGKLEFTVTVPAELKNAYALKNTKVKWVFRVEEDKDNLTSIPSKEPNMPENSGNEEKENYSSPVQTGDGNETRLIFNLSLLILSCTIVLWAYRKGEEER